MQNNGLPKDVIIILAGGTFFLIMITLFIVLLLIAYKKRDRTHIMERKKLEEEFNNQLLQSQIEVQEQTFQQIGKELHDNVGQLLSTSRMLIGLTERNLSTPSDTLHTANETLGKAISELRSLSKSLDKDWLEQFDFIQNLNTEIERINVSGNITATLTKNERPALPSAKQIILFRIVQEAIQNAIKHGHCRKLAVGLDSEGEMFKITVNDDGVGFDVQKTSTGMGLKNMQYRTQLLGGQILYESGPGGTSVTIFVPENKSIHEN